MVSILPLSLNYDCCHATGNISTTTKDMLQCYKICCPCHSSAPNARCWPVSRHQPPQPPTILGLLRPPANRGPGGSPPPMGGEAASWPPQPANHRPALTSPGWPGSFGLCCNLHLFSGHLHCSSCFLSVTFPIPLEQKILWCLILDTFVTAILLSITLKLRWKQFQSTSHQMYSRVFFVEMATIVPDNFEMRCWWTLQWVQGYFLCI